MKTEPKKTQLEIALAKFGINEKEIAVYKLLLRLGKASVTTIIKESGLKKGNTYDVLYRLEELGLVIRVTEMSSLHFQVEAPEKLLNLAQTQKEDLEAAEKSIKAMLPALNSQYQFSVGKPTIAYYEGEEGIKEVFEDIYAPKDDPVYGCVDLDQSDETYPQYIMKKLIPKRIRNKVYAFTILNDSKNAREVAKKDSTHLRTSLLAPKDKYPLPAEIDVYEDKIAMMTFNREKFIGLIIQNQDLATTLKSIFKLAFDAKKENK